MMEQIILHQYWQSPFTEKVRVVLGMKNLRWRLVEQPTIMPKPELVPLTGGEVVVHFPRAGFTVTAR